MGTQCLLWMAALCGTLAVTSSGSDFGEAVYSNCSEARYAQGSAYESNLGKFMASILSQKPSNGYRNVSVGAGNVTVRGLFQCRGDLGDADCYECKKSAVARAPQLCGGTVGARVQLRGCYLRYDNGARLTAVGGPESPVYKACSPEVTADPGFIRSRDAVFATLEKESLDGNGYLSTNSGGDSGAPRVSGTSQCKRDLAWPECGYCVVKAVQELEDSCGASVRGQVYLEKCSATYSMDNPTPSAPHSMDNPPPTAPQHQDPTPSAPQHQAPSPPSSKSNHVDSKTIAIVIGGVASAIFAFIFLLFLKSLCKSED